VQFFSLGSDKTPLSINNLPLDIDKTLEIPLLLETTENGRYDLVWANENLPASWDVMLEDMDTGTRIDLNNQHLYQFEVGVAKSTTVNRSLFDKRNLKRIASLSEPRFMLTISNRTAVSLDDPARGIPNKFQLDQNYPNPFNPSTVIQFGLPKAAEVRIDVFNVLGKRVRVLVNKPFQPGFHEVNFDATSLSSGLYIYRIQAENFIQTKKMLLIK